MPPFKDESVVIISPGSQYTLAQLGLPESFTPPAWRFPTRMFPGPNPGEWEPTEIRAKARKSRKATTPQPGTTNGATVNGADSTDLEMKDAPNPEPGLAENAEDATAGPDADLVYEEDPTATEGAVYPLKDGQVENWPCFFALLTHISDTLSPPFHTPVLVIAQPCWSARDRELLTQFFFESFKIPAFCLMDAALAACYAYGVPTATIVDVGHTKCDITAVNEYLVCDVGRGTAIKGVGGQGMTQRLLELLEKNGFDEPMCEALKRSAICEILLPDVPLPSEPQSSDQGVVNPAAAASTGAVDSGAATNGAIGADGSKMGTASRGPGQGTEVGMEAQNGDDEENEGILDVASIVAKDNASEILARREKERLEKLAAKKNAGVDAPKPARLKNSERPTASFSYEDDVPIDGDDDVAKESGGEQGRTRKRKRDVVVGLERFMAVSPSSTPASSEGILDTIANTIHNTILSVSHVPMRSTLWENLIILGNGSRIRGFTPALLAVLTQRFAVSPSTATIFTSELPSNLSTPMPTGGTNTPVPGQPSHPMHHPGGHGVNPLLVAATHAHQSQSQSQSQTQTPQQQQQHPHLHPSSAASVALHGAGAGVGAGVSAGAGIDQSPQVAPLPHLHPGPGGLPHPQQHHRGHNQTPTSIRLVKPPDYFPEWKDSTGAAARSGTAAATTTTTSTTSNKKTSTNTNTGAAVAAGSATAATTASAAAASSTTTNSTGMEEAIFLGAQVAAKVVFVVDQGISKGSLTRADYNEMGPGGIHECAM